jgi:8-oxo-dGTP diphosphatase
MNQQISHGVECAVVNKNGDFLLLKRSPDKKLFPNKWFVVGAYPLSENDDFESIAHRELVDELGIDGNILKSGKIIKNSNHGMAVVVHSFLAEISDSNIKLNDEHTEFKWVKLEEIKNFDTVSNTYEMISALVLQNE